MSSIIFSAEPAGGREQVVAALAGAQQDPSVRKLLQAGGAGLTLSPPHPVYTLLLGSEGELARENIEYCCMGYAVMDGEQGVGAAWVDTGTIDGASSLGLRKLTFGPSAGSIGAALERAKTLAAANGPATVALLAIPELHVEALWLKPSYGAGADIVLPLDPAALASAQAPQTLEQFLAALAPLALAASSAADVL